MNHGFLESETGRMNADESFFHIIPAPFEETVSYGGGTSMAPSAILDASNQLEVFDGVSIPAELGIYTAPAIDCSTGVDQLLDDIDMAVSAVFSHNSCPVLLGGEHTVSYGAFRAVDKLDKAVGIIQFDAHADMRDSYEGSPWSHACVMRRGFDLGLPLFQIANRSYSPEEKIFRDQNTIPYYDARQSYDALTIPDSIPKDVYITVDVDGFDSSVMPATGTPEPGGMQWFQFFSVVEKIAASRNIIGFDLVELAPINGFHAYDFMCARLIYNMMGIIQRSRS